MLRPAIFRSGVPGFFDDSFDRMFDNAFRGFWGPSSSLARSEAFNTDVIDEGDHYLVQAELPGFNKEDLNVELKDNTLTITAAHNEDKEAKKPNYIRRERSYSSYSRSFHVEGLRPEDIQASYNNGILEITLPKNEIEVTNDPKRIEIH